MCLKFSTTTLTCFKGKSANLLASKVIIYKMNKVSIVIPVFNREKWVSEAIESALAQTHKKIEVVVVNDGSTDKSETEILKFKDKVKYIRQGNMGPAVARNTGIKAATGSFIVPLDSDDKLDPLFI